MRNGTFCGALALVIGMMVPASAGAAECRAGQRFGKIGTTLTASGVLTSSSAQVRLLSVSGDGSASVFGIYDTGGLSTASNALLVIEPTAAANATVMVPPFGFFDPPLDFATGITVVFSNGQSVSAFGCIDR